MVVANIGSGAFGKVDHVVDKQEGTHFAVKRIVKRGIDVCYSEANLKMETGILSQLKHDHIVKYVGYFENDECYSIVTEWVNGKKAIVEKS